MLAACATSAQAKAYAAAALRCAAQLGAVSGDLADVTDPGRAAAGTTFRSPGAERLRSLLGDVGSELKGAQARVQALISDLFQAAARYDELAEKLHQREQAAKEEKLRDAARLLELPQTFPGLSATPPPLRGRG